MEYKHGISDSISGKIQSYILYELTNEPLISSYVKFHTRSPVDAILIELTNLQIAVLT